MTSHRARFPSSASKAHSSEGDSTRCSANEITTMSYSSTSSSPSSGGLVEPGAGSLPAATSEKEISRQGRPMRARYAGDVKGSEATMESSGSERAGVAGERFGRTAGRAEGPREGGMKGCRIGSARGREGCEVAGGGISVGAPPSGNRADCTPATVFPSAFGHREAFHASMACRSGFSASNSRKMEGTSDPPRLLRPIPQQDPAP